MERDDIGNRMALGITTILTIMFLLGSLNGNLPKVSYPKALDWYLLVSFSFVFLTLIECLIVYLFAKRAKDEEQMKFKVKVYCVRCAKSLWIHSAKISTKTVLKGKNGKSYFQPKFCPNSSSIPIFLFLTSSTNDLNAIFQERKLLDSILPMKLPSSETAHWRYDTKRNER